MSQNVRRKYVVKIGNTTYEVEVERINENTFKAFINGKEVQVTISTTPTATRPAPTVTPAPAPATTTRIQTPQAQPTPALEAPKPAPTPAPAGGKTIVAQLPGKVLKVLVKPGDRVKKGDVVLTIESMKMEVEIYAEADGVVKEVRVKPGDAVNTGDVLVVMG
jgi:glutaconyl-CoA decarboxylase